MFNTSIVRPSDFFRTPPGREAHMMSRKHAAEQAARGRRKSVSEQLPGRASIARGATPNNKVYGQHKEMSDIMLEQEVFDQGTFHAKYSVQFSHIAVARSPKSTTDVMLEVTRTPGEGYSEGSWYLVRCLTQGHRNSLCQKLLDTQIASFDFDQ